MSSHPSDRNSPEHPAPPPACIQNGNLPAVLSLALGSFASVTAEFLPVGGLPEVAKTFGVSEGNAGLMMTLPGALAAISAPGVMMLAGRTDRRRILLALSTLLLAACLISAWALSFWVMLASRAMVGVSLGAFWAMALAVAVRLVPEVNAHRAAATVFAGVTAAMILGVPLGTWIAEHTSWRGAFIAAAGISAVSMLVQVWALPQVYAEEGLRISSLLRFVRRAAPRKSMAMITLVFAAHFGTYTFISPLMLQAGISASSITLVLLGFGVAGFASNLLATHFIGRSLPATLFTVKVLLMVSLGALPMLMSLPGAGVVVTLLWGLAWGALPLSLNTWNRNVAGKEADASAAMFTFVAQVAIAMGSGAGGVVVDHLGIAPTFWAGAVVTLLSVLLLVTYRPQDSYSAKG